MALETQAGRENLDRQAPKAPRETLVARVNQVFLGSMEQTETLGRTATLVGTYVLGVLYLTTVQSGLCEEFIGFTLYYFIHSLT